MSEQDQGPSLGVSACLLGEPVRYDGGHKRDETVTGLLSRFFRLVPLCPEREAGLGVPRPPVHLVRRDGQVRAVGVEDAGLDVTERVLEVARRHDRRWAVDGLVVKARSPSCALDSAPLDGGEGTGPGLFTGHLVQRRPWLPCIQEDGLQDPWQRLLFLERAWIGYGLRCGLVGCLRPSWVYRLQGRGPGGIDQDPARSLEEALARPWRQDQLATQLRHLQQDPQLP